METGHTVLGRGRIAFQIDLNEFSSIDARRNLQIKGKQLSSRVSSRSNKAQEQCGVALQKNSNVTLINFQRTLVSGVELLEMSLPK